MEEKQVKKEMLLRMIIRCNKVRKHKPKRVKNPTLSVGVYESIEFPESGIKKKRYYSPSETYEIRRNLQNLDLSQKS